MIEYISSQHFSAIFRSLLKISFHLSSMTAQMLAQTNLLSALSSTLRLFSNQILHSDENLESSLLVQSAARIHGFK